MSENLKIYHIGGLVGLHVRNPDDDWAELAFVDGPTIHVTRKDGLKVMELILKARDEAQRDAARAIEAHLRSAVARGVDACVEELEHLKTKLALFEQRLETKKQVQFEVNKALDDLNEREE